jgi:hypothetical protein
MEAISPLRRGESGPIKTLRSAVLVIFAIGMVGTAAELVLLEHTEDVWQWVPLVLMAISAVNLVWIVAVGGRASLRAFQSTMTLFVVSGFVGLFLHYRGNVEFEMEMYPTLSGLKLFWEAIKGATPALAPGTMLQLGLLGLAFTYNHPHSAARRAGDQDKGALQ